MINRNLIGVGFYRSQNAPDLALYLGEPCYAGLDKLWCRLTENPDNAGQPAVDHFDEAFDGAIELAIRPSLPGKLNTREAHVRRRDTIREAWPSLSCSARGFAKSSVLTIECGPYMRSLVTEWHIEPGTKLRLPAFTHTAVSRAIAEKEHTLFTLSHEDREALVSHFEVYGMNAAQIAAVLGCSVKTVQKWRLRAANGFMDAHDDSLPPAPTDEASGDAEVDSIVQMAMELTADQRTAIIRRIQGR